MNRASENYMSHQTPEESINYTLNRGIFGGLRTAIVTSIGLATVCITWAYVQVFRATREEPLEKPEVVEPTT
jgi:hypothetical protein